MAPSRSSVLVLLGLAVSTQAIPAAHPQAAGLAPRQLGLPSSFSISWDPPLPTATSPSEDPEEDPEEPGHPPPAPKPTDQISLNPPSYTVSWDIPGETQKPEEPANPPVPTPTDQISLNPPSYSVSWDGPQVPTTAISSTSSKPVYSTKVTSSKKPGRPTKPHNPWKPSSSKTKTTAKTSSAKTTAKPSSTKHDPVPTGGTEDPEDPENPEEPEEPEVPSNTPSTPPDQITLAPPSATISWGKRQFDTEPVQTGCPEEDTPEDDGPIGFPGGTQAPPNPPDVITLAPPSATISWGKRQGNDITLVQPTATIGWGKRQDEEEPDEPEDPEPEDPEDPEDPDEPSPPAPAPPDDITLIQPTATVTWGKRQEDGATLVQPTATLIRGKKRQDEDDPFLQDPSFPLDPFPEDPIPGLPNLPVPTLPDEVTLVQPTATISWGKREAEAEAAPQTNSWGIVWPTNVPFPPIVPPVHTLPPSITWGKRAPLPTNNPLNPRFTCYSIATTTTLRPCPQPTCSSPCTYIPEKMTTPFPGVDTATAIPSCPLTLTASNVCATCGCPSSQIPSTSTSTSITSPEIIPAPTTASTPVCSTVTQTAAPPCVPPICPKGGDVPCKVADATLVPFEPTTFLSVVSPTRTTIGGGASGGVRTGECEVKPTKTLWFGCPTYSCVPGGMGCKA